MKYTVLLRKKPEGGIHASTPALPDCTFEAENRDDAIRMARKSIVEMVSRSEIVQVDVPQQPETSSTPDAIPWEWFGAAKDDATWNPLFDEIERNRDATRKGVIRRMYLWDTIIVRHFGQGHPTLRLHLLRVPWVEIALPSVVIVEVLRGRCDFAVKALPGQAPVAHQRLLETLHMLARFFMLWCSTKPA